MGSLSDGQAEFFDNYDSETIHLYASVVNPGANGIVLNCGQPPAGIYKFTILARYGAVGDVPDNMNFRRQGSPVAQLPVQGVANSVITPYTFIMKHDGGGNMFVQAVNATAANSVYTASITYTKIGELG